MTWELVYTKHAQKDAQKLSSAGLKEKTHALLMVLRENPFQNPPPYEKLTGDLSGAYSRRINIQHRLVYQVLVPYSPISCSFYKKLGCERHLSRSSGLEDLQVIKVLRMWSHYD